MYYKFFARVIEITLERSIRKFSYVITCHSKRSDFTIEVEPLCTNVNVLLSSSHAPNSLYMLKILALSLLAGVVKVLAPSILADVVTVLTSFLLADVTNVRKRKGAWEVILIVFALPFIQIQPDFC